MGFDVVNPNRIEVFNLAGCALIRVTGTTTTHTKRAVNPRAISIGRRCAATGARPGEVLNGPHSGRCCACGAAVNAVAPVARSLPQHAPRPARQSRRQPGAGDVRRALQGGRHRRQGAEHEQPAHRPARQRLRRPAHQSDAVRLRRQRNAAVDHATSGNARPGRRRRRSSANAYRRCRASTRCRRRSRRGACRPTRRWGA